MKTLEVSSRAAWREWLASSHAESEVWLLFTKRDAGGPALTYEAAVEEALCHGWIDSLVKRVDESRYARKFTPRKPDSKWSTANRRRYEKMAAEGKLEAAGVDRPPTARSGDAPRPDLTVVPAYIQAAFDNNSEAARFLEQLAPSQRRLYIAWIDAAKREATRHKRLDEAIMRLAAGEKLGLK